MKRMSLKISNAMTVPQTLGLVMKCSSCEVFTWRGRDESWRAKPVLLLKHCCLSLKDLRKSTTKIEQVQHDFDMRGTTRYMKHTSRHPVVKQCERQVSPSWVANEAVDSLKRRYRGWDSLMLHAPRLEAFPATNRAKSA